MSGRVGQGSKGEGEVRFGVQSDIVFFKVYISPLLPPSPLSFLSFPSPFPSLLQLPFLPPVIQFRERLHVGHSTTSIWKPTHPSVSRRMMASLLSAPPSGLLSPRLLSPMSWAFQLAGDCNTLS